MLRGAITALLAVVLLGVVGTLGRIPGTPDQPPPSNHPTGCEATQLATDGAPPPGSDAAKVIARIKATCVFRPQPDTGSLTGYTPTTNAQGDVPARQSCLDMQ